jgi:hypothetical protein
MMSKKFYLASEVRRLCRDMRATHRLLKEEASALMDEELRWSPGGQAPSAQEVLRQLIRAERMLLDAAKKMHLAIALEEHQNGQSAKE